MCAHTERKRETEPTKTKINKQKTRAIPKSTPALGPLSGIFLQSKSQFPWRQGHETEQVYRLTGQSLCLSAREPQPHRIFPNTLALASHSEPETPRNHHQSQGCFKINFISLYIFYFKTFKKGSFDIVFKSLAPAGKCTHGLCSQYLHGQV